MDKHDWVPTGHETMACQYPGCGLSPMGSDRPAFFAAHEGPIVAMQRKSAIMSGHEAIDFFISDELPDLLAGAIYYWDFTYHDVAEARAGRLIAKIKELRG